MSGWHVTENDVKNWTATDKRRSEELLPQLIYKLIRASSNPRKIDFPFVVNFACASMKSGCWLQEFKPGRILASTDRWIQDSILATCHPIVMLVQSASILKI